MSNATQQQSKGGKDDWMSPPRVLRPLKSHDHIDLDPCAGEFTAIGEVANYRLPDNDGLADSWHVETPHYDRVGYCNPEFSNKVPWLQKAVEEFEKGNIDRVYFLTPDGTDVKSWWHGWIVPNFRWTWFPKGRINFIDPAPDVQEQVKGASGNSAVHVLGNPPTSLLREWNETGDLVHRFDEIPEVRPT